MSENQKEVSGRGVFMLLSLLLNAVILKQAFINHVNWYWLLIISLPLFVISLFTCRN